MCGADQKRLPCKSRKALVRRIPKTGVGQRKDLPQMLPGLLKKINEAVSFLAKVSNAVRGWQRGRMKKNS